MSYYIFVENDKLNGAGQCRCLNENIQNIEVEQSVYEQYIDDSDYYIWDGETIVENPDYEDIKRQKEQERINNLTMTALDFIGVLENNGLDYVTQIKPFLEANPELDKQLKYCQNVWCGVAKQVFREPITIGNVTITAEMVESAFRIKNGELSNDN